MQPGTATPQATTDRLPLRTASTPRTTATSRPVTATRPTSSGSSPTWPARPTPHRSPIARTGSTTRCPSGWRGRSGIPGVASPAAAPTSPAETDPYDRSQPRRPTPTADPTAPGSLLPHRSDDAAADPGDHDAGQHLPRLARARLRDMEEPDADARVHRQAELGDR